MITKHDIVMVGGGGAGLRAAISIAETNPNLSVAVVSKIYPMRSHTVAAEGGAAAVIKDTILWKTISMIPLLEETGCVIKMRWNFL